MDFVKSNTEFNNIEIITTTKKGGFSNLPFSSLNLSYDVLNNPEDVLKNREILFKELNLLPYNVIIPKLLNTDKVVKIEHIEDSHIGDAFYTYNKDIVISILNNFISPIFFYDKEKEIIGVINTSINSSFLELPKKLIKTLIKEEKCKLENLYFYFTPGVSFMEIKATEKDIRKATNSNYTMCLKKTLDTTYLDVNMLNFMQLRNMGIPLDHIFHNEINIKEDQDTFFYKDNENNKGMMLSLIKFNK